MSLEVNTIFFIINYSNVISFVETEYGSISRLRVYQICMSHMYSYQYQSFSH